MKYLPKKSCDISTRPAHIGQSYHIARAHIGQSYHIARVHTGQSYHIARAHIGSVSQAVQSLAAAVINASHANENGWSDTLYCSTHTQHACLRVCLLTQCSRSAYMRTRSCRALERETF